MSVSSSTTGPFGLGDRREAMRGGTEQLRSRLLAAASTYGYQPIDVPVVEASDLYLLKAGETIATQLCELVSRKRLSLRPEHTASVVRVFAENLHGEALPLRLSYVGPVFRWSEGLGAPRQFHEMGIELFGLGGLAGELELLALASRCLVALGLSEFQARIGHVGIIQRYLDSLGLDRRLSSFLLTHREVLRDEGSSALLELLRERLPEFYDVAVKTNGNEERRQLRELLSPLEDADAHAVLRDFLSLTQLADDDESGPDEDDIERLLIKLRRVDSSTQFRKAIGFIEEIAQLVGEVGHVIPEAQRLLSRYEQDRRNLRNLEELLTHLAAAGVEPGAGWLLDLGLSRGLHYYSGMIFEIFHGVGNGATRIGGGGRYDGLIELFGGPPTPACGFSFGLERLVAARVEEGVSETKVVRHHRLMVSEARWGDALPWAEKMRAAGCAIVMMPGSSEELSEGTLYLIDAEKPLFQWRADGEQADALGWEDTLSRLKSAGSRADD